MTIHEIQRPSGPEAVIAMRRMKLLVGSYLGISALSLLATAVMRNHPALVNAAVWTRGIIVVASALLAFSLAVRAAHGSRRALLRLRIVSAVMVVAIAVIIAIPGSFPLWMKIEQGACGLLLVGVILVLNRKPVRAPHTVG